MQRYRINYHWLIGVFVGSLVLAIAGYFVWSWQVNRKAGYFLRLAEAALAEENPQEAFDQLRKYVQLRPEEVDARRKLGDAAVKLIRSPDVTFEQLGQALAVLDQAVRTTDDAELRRELAEILMMFRRPQDAIGHFEELLADDPDDSELDELLARALYQAKDYARFIPLAYKLIGYDKKTDEFISEKSSVVGESDVYSLLIDVLVKREKNPELARRVIDQVIAADPDSAAAYLRKSIFLSGIGDSDEARTFLDKAHDLDPKNASILARKGLVALSETNYDEAKQYYSIGLKEHEENPHFYRMMAETEYRLEQTDAALEILDTGIREFEDYLSIELVLYKIDVLLGQRDYAGVEREIERLEKLNRPDMVPLIDFQRARITFARREWAQASKELKRIRPLLFARPKYPITVRPPNFEAMAGAMLGVSYESQGIPDLALQAYETVLVDSPDNPAALKGRERIRAKIDPQQREGENIALEEVINKTLLLPKAEQDWNKIEELVKEVIAENELAIAHQKLLRAKVLIKRERFKEAVALIRQAGQDAPDDINVHYAAILLVVSDPEQGSSVALKLLDRLEKKWGRTLRSRIQRADLLAHLNPDDVVARLRALLDDTSDFSELDTLRLYKVLGLKFEQLGKLVDAREFYEKSAAMEPNNLPIRMHLFDLSFRQRDDAAMQKAQEAILGFVKSKNDASYILTEVKRRIMSFSLGEIDQAELAASRALLDTALVQRPQWHELHITYGQLLLLLNEDVELALKYFDDALKYGPPKSNAVGIQVKLLAERGLYPQARERMERVRPEIRGRLLGQLEAEILIKTGDQAEGFEVAGKLAEAQPNNSAVQLWYSKLAQEMGKLDVAITALRRALERNPSAPDNWLRLIGLHVEQKNIEAIESVLREAHLATEADALPILTGKKHELSSSWQMAEDIYLAAYADQLDNLAIARRLADFYLFWAQKDEANLGRAATYINRILRAANEGKAAPDDPHVVWARQKAAKILSSNQDYQNSLKAERLLRESMVANVMTSAESELLVDILISRNDPTSLLQATELLTELGEANRLPTKGALQLARILSQSEQWDKSRELMLELIAKNPSDLQVRTTYIELLINQGEYSSAESALKRLRDMSPKGSTVVQLSTRLAAARGDQARLNRMLKSLLPKMGGAMTAAELNTVLRVAQMATLHGDYELAGELYDAYVGRVPAEAFELAKFLAYHGDCDRAIDLMKRLSADRTDDVVQLANRMITVRRDEVGDKYDEDVDRLINGALRKDPDSIMRQLARAEAYDAQEKYNESIETYERLLARDDLPARMRAAAMNNLGFLLALLNRRVDEAEQMINAAMETFGPVEDMLDTRALVRIAQGKYDLAIEDMELALSISRDPVKYFHLAKAYILAGDGQAATRAWGKAQELGFEKDALSKLEKPGFEKILQKIEDFQAQNAKL